MKHSRERSKIGHLQAGSNKLFSPNKAAHLSLWKGRLFSFQKSFLLAGPKENPSPIFSLTSEPGRPVFHSGEDLPSASCPGVCWASHHSQAPCH